MTPARRRTTSPASQRPEASAEAKDGAQQLGAEGEPLAQDARTGDAGGVAAPATETAPVDPEHRATTQLRRRPSALYPLPVWPD